MADVENDKRVTDYFNTVKKAYKDFYNNKTAAPSFPDSNDSAGDAQGIFKRARLAAAEELVAEKKHSDIDIQAARNDYHTWFGELNSTYGFHNQPLLDKKGEGKLNSATEVNSGNATSYAQALAYAAAVSNVSYALEGKEPLTEAAFNVDGAYYAQQVATAAGSNIITDNGHSKININVFHNFTPTVEAGYPFARIKAELESNGKPLNLPETFKPPVSAGSKKPSPAQPLVDTKPAPQTPPSAKAEAYTTFKANDDAIQVAKNEIFALDGWTAIEQQQGAEKKYTEAVLNQYGEQFRTHPESRQKIYAELAQKSEYDANSKTHKHPEYAYAMEIFARSEQVEAQQRQNKDLRLSAFKNEQDAFDHLNPIALKAAEPIVAPAPLVQAAKPSANPDLHAPIVPQAPKEAKSPTAPVVHKPIPALDLGGDYTVGNGDTLSRIAAASKELMVVTKEAMGGNPKPHEIALKAANVLLDYNHSQYTPGDKDYINDLKVIKVGQVVSLPPLNELRAHLAQEKGLDTTVARPDERTGISHPEAADAAEQAAARQKDALDAVHKAGVKITYQSPYVGPVLDARTQKAMDAISTTVHPIWTPDTHLDAPLKPDDFFKRTGSVEAAPEAAVPDAPGLKRRTPEEKAEIADKRNSAATFTVSDPNVTLEKLIKDAEKGNGPLKHLLDDLTTAMGHKKIDKDVERAARMLIRDGNTIPQDGALGVATLTLPSDDQIDAAVEVLADGQPHHNALSKIPLLNKLPGVHSGQGIEVSASEEKNPDMIAKLHTALDAQKGR